LNKYNPYQSQPEVAENVTNLIQITEQQSRDKLSEMIGEKIIAKVFNDNLRDFKQEEDMEPIQNICSIITRVLIILKELDVKQKAQIECQVLYRSNILQILFQYIQMNYQVDAFPMDNIAGTNHKIIRKIQRDEEFLSLFTFIISKRLIVMDDIEFQGKNKNNKYEQYPFIKFEEIRYLSWILNNMAYRIFWSNETSSKFTDEFLDNLKRAITGLYDRDKRMKLHGENFWIIEKDMLQKYDQLTHDEITGAISHSLLLNLPHAIPFQLRAKIFQHIIFSQGEEYH
jgi:hypothetical protein